MSQTNGAAARNTLSVRPANSRKLLARKAAELAPAADANPEDALEACFPGADELQDTGAAQPDNAAAAEYIEPAAQPHLHAAAPVADGAAEGAAAAATPAEPALEPEAALSSPAVPSPAPLPATAAAWYADDEAALNAMLARRKAAGYQRRGRDVSGQLIRLGDIAPNPNTVVAVIVGLVAHRGTVARDELVRLMATAVFPNAKAKPTDAGWCTGYVAGAIRSGHLVVAECGEDSQRVSAAAAPAEAA